MSMQDGAGRGESCFPAFQGCAVEHQGGRVAAAGVAPSLKKTCISQR